MHAAIVLTVAQGKRLIARAVTHLPEVRQAMNDGLIAIGRGTTNGYVAEELLGHGIPKGEYVAGRTLPPGVPLSALGTGNYPDIILKSGVLQDGMTLAEAVELMGPGDVLIKGGNALNYEQKVVGVLIGHPNGGTLGDNYGRVISRKISLVIPIGLEKLVVEDISALSRASRLPDSHPQAGAHAAEDGECLDFRDDGAGNGEKRDHARLLAAGGVAGAEGAIWLMLEGNDHQLELALGLCHSLQHEPNFGLLVDADHR